MAKGTWPEKSLAVAVNEVADQLTLGRDFFHKVRTEGGGAEFFIGWFFEGNSGDEFKTGLLTKLASLQIDLSLDIYPPADQSQSNF